MGKVPIRLREVVYTLSPFEQTVMNGVFKDVPEKLHRKFSEVRQLLTSFIYADLFSSLCCTCATTLLSRAELD